MGISKSKSVSLGIRPPADVKLRPNTKISSSTISALWRKYDPEDQGYIEYDDVFKFLREFARAINVEYTRARADAVLAAACCGKGMNLRKTHFSTIVPLYKLQGASASRTDVLSQSVRSELDRKTKTLLHHHAVSGNVDALATMVSEFNLDPTPVLESLVLVEGKFDQVLSVLNSVPDESLNPALVASLIGRAPHPELLTALSRKLPINSTDMMGRTFLHHYLQSPRDRCMPVLKHALFELGADPTVRDVNGFTAVELVINSTPNDPYQVIPLLLEGGAELHSSSEANGSLLSRSLGYGGMFSTARTLLAHGCNPNGRGRREPTVMEDVITQNVATGNESHWKDGMKLFLKYGADPGVLLRRRDEINAKVDGFMEELMESDDFKRAEAYPYRWHPSLHHQYAAPEFRKCVLTIYTLLLRDGDGYPIFVTPLAEMPQDVIWRIVTTALDSLWGVWDKENECIRYV